MSSRQFSVKCLEIHSWITVSLDTYIFMAHIDKMSFGFDRRFSFTLWL